MFGLGGVLAGEEMKKHIWLLFFFLVQKKKKREAINVSLFLLIMIFFLVLGKGRWMRQKKMMCGTVKRSLMAERESIAISPGLVMSHSFK